MPPAPEPALGWMHEGTELFLKALESLDDEALAAPGTLPGWTGRHVVAHVAANAEALGNLVHWARTGEETPMYSSPEQRGADIEAGAQRPVAELRHWVASSAARLADSLDALTPDAVGPPGAHRPGPHRAGDRDPLDAVARGDGARRRPRRRGDLRRPARRLRRGAARRHRGEAVAPVPTAPHLRLAPTDDDRTWAVTAAGDTVTVRGPLAQLTAYLSGRPATGLHADGAAVPSLPRWL